MAFVLGGHCLCLVGGGECFLWQAGLCEVVCGGVPVGSCLLMTESVGFLLGVWVKVSCTGATGSR